jgi:hypothetical protein
MNSFGVCFSCKKYVHIVNIEKHLCKECNR